MPKLKGSASRGCSSPRGGRRGVLDEFEAELFDHRVGKYFAGNRFDLLLGGGAVEAFELQDEELSFADVGDRGMAQRGQSVLNGFSLGIEDSALQHDPDVRSHGGHYSSPSARDCW